MNQNNAMIVKKKLKYFYYEQNCQNFERKNVQICSTDFFRELELLFDCIFRNFKKYKYAM